MPHYFFETDDGVAHWSDKVGVELDDDEAARTAVLEALPDMARERLPLEDRCTLKSVVRNTNGEVVYAATMIIDGKWQLQQS